jgi:glycine hydroxymethyltransferase
MNPINIFTQNELERQKNSLNLIASENYPSPKVLQLLGSCWSLKYGEGYPGKRYYAGNQNTDDLETFVQQKALQVFDETNGEYGVNVQVLSGSPANSVVYLAVLKPGDTVMSLSLVNGGHLSHLHATSSYNKFFSHVNYDLNSDCEIDIEDFTKNLIEHKPKLVIIGFSAYPKRFSCKTLTKIAHKYGALVLADIAHINGLVAARLHDTPFASGDLGADFVSMTTHKTLRGPRGALLFAKQEFMESINKTIFPGTSGGPHFHQIAAVGQCLLEILGEENYPDLKNFVDYSKEVISNTKILEDTLINTGLLSVSPTQTHLSLVGLPSELDSLVIQQKLELFGIILNRNLIPFDTKSAWRPSGLRVGAAALTSRGLTQEMTKNLGVLITDIIFDRGTEISHQKKVQDLVSQLNWYY